MGVRPRLKDAVYGGGCDDVVEDGGSVVECVVDVCAFFEVYLFV